uniref:Uncharacterized protein MANES_13G072100 n=1 Tax=Rhizophora mucronata TaxID=61149 RepID=A0A2P2IMR5_RHIMU
MRHLHHPWKSLPFSNPKPAETLILPFPGAIDAHAAPTRFPLSPQSSSVCAELQTPPSPWTIDRLRNLFLFSFRAPKS